MDRPGTPHLTQKFMDCEQHVYVGAVVTLNEVDRWVVVEISFPSTAVIRREFDETTVQEVDVSQQRVLVLQHPEEVNAGNSNVNKVAPFHLDDEYGYANEEYFWLYEDAYKAAEEFVADNDRYVEIINAYGNTIEMVEPDEDDEEEDDDA